MSVLLGVAGIALVVLAWRSVLNALVVPRSSHNRVNRTVGLVIAVVYRFVAGRIRSYPRRDRLLASAPAVSILLQLLVWLALLYVGFSFLFTAFQPAAWRQAFIQVGSSLMTLGYAGPSNAAQTIVDLAAATSGLVVIALQIGYLPALYSAFNRRETEVTLLLTRAGTPAWGPEILAGTRDGFGAQDIGVGLHEFYAHWERWSADLYESHTNYPVLLFFRSPARDSSWLVSLVAVMDSAALWLALSPGRAPAAEARLALRMGSTALQAVAQTLGMPGGQDPDGALLLTYDEYLDGVSRLASTSFPMDRTPEQAWPDFRGWRVNYEAVAYALADRLDVVPAPWTGVRSIGGPTPPTAHSSVHRGRADGFEDSGTGVRKDAPA